jgi:hypothetical protein
MRRLPSATLLIRGVGVRPGGKGQYLTGALGSVTGLRSILEAQPISCLLVSSSTLERERLEQAVNICQERRIPMRQAHLKLEPVAVEPGRVNGVQSPAHIVPETSHSA